jgi:hypothetical protein
MTAPDPTEIRMHLTGSPSVEATGAAASALRGLIDTLAKRAIPWQIEARLVCDHCGAESEPVDLTRPDDAEATLREAGWARDTDAATDTCPACAARVATP